MSNDVTGAEEDPAEPSEAALLEVSTSGVRYKAQGPDALHRVSHELPRLAIASPLILAPILFAGLAWKSLVAAGLALLVCLGAWIALLLYARAGRRPD